MAQGNLSELCRSLLAHEEAEWIEFKLNNCEPQEIGENISAISNAARLHQRERGYILWGIKDGSRSVLGTAFLPRKKKIGNQELENWLATQLEPRIDFTIHELELDGKPMVLFSIQPCSDRPVGFKGVEHIRVGSYTKKLKDHPEKERALWIKGSQLAFERELAASGVREGEVLSLLNAPAFFKLRKQAPPARHRGSWNSLKKRSSSSDRATRNGT